MNSVPGCICSGIHTSRKFSSATILASSSHGCLSFTTHVRCTDLSLRLRKSTPGLWYVLAPLLVQRISDFPALSIAYLKRGCSLVPFGPTATLACLLLHESRCFKRRCRRDRGLRPEGEFTWRDTGRCTSAGSAESPARTPASPCTESTPRTRECLYSRHSTSTAGPEHRRRCKPPEHTPAARRTDPAPASG